MRRTSKVDKKIRKKKIGLIIVILFFISSFFFILFTKTEFFNVTKIEVINNNELTIDKVIMASGILIGENTFMINTSLLEDNLATHPYIKEATVKRKFPNRIIMEVTERKHFMTMSYVGSFLHLDNEGVLLNISNSRGNENIPLVNGLQITNTELGSELVLNDENNILDIASFFDFSDIVGLYDRIDILEVVDNFDINFQLKTGTRVAFGYFNNVKYKLSFIVKILDKLYERGDLDESNASKGFIDLTQGEDAVFTLESN